MSEWPVANLGDLATIQQGRYLAKDEMAEVASPDNPVPVHGANGIIGWTTEPMYRHGVPLVTCRGSNSGMVLWGNGPLWVSNNAMALLPRDGDVRFLYYLLRWRPPYDVVTGSAQPQITRRDLERKTYPWPDVDTQSAIANLLGALDQKIELNRRTNHVLEATARAFFNDWFVQFGPSRSKMEGKEAYLEPGLWSLFPSELNNEDIPSGWRRGRLQEIAVAPVRTVLPQDVDPSTPYIALEHMPRRSIALGEWARAEKATTNKSQFKSGEFLFGKLRPYFHKVGIAPVDGICSTDIVVVAPKDERWSAIVLACISSDDFVEHSNLSSTGTKMPRTSWRIMRSFELTLPPLEVAEAFETMCGPMINRIVANVEESRSLAALRDLLLPKLMSGEVSIAPSEGAAVP